MFPQCCQILHRKAQMSANRHIDTVTGGPLRQASLASAELIWRAIQNGQFTGHPSGIELPAVPQMSTCGNIQRLVPATSGSIVSQPRVRCSFSAAQGQEIDCDVFRLKVYWSASLEPCPMAGQNSAETTE